MWGWIIGWWLIIDGLISLIVHVPDKRQSWSQDHSVRVVRSVLGVVLCVLTFEDMRRLKGG